MFKAIKEGFLARTRSAGGFYNFGNVLDLYSVTASAIVMRAPHESIVGALENTLVGNPSNLFFSLAALVFFAGGECYHQAWKKGYPPNRELNLSGDTLSGVGATLLGTALLGIGNPVLAAASGGLHAISKFGSALGYFKELEPTLNRQFRLAGYVTTGIDVIKDLALLSRAPAIALSLLSIEQNFSSQPTPQAVAHSLMPAILTWCYTEWARADWMLTQPSSVIRQAVSSARKKMHRVIGMTEIPLSLAENTMQALHEGKPIPGTHLSGSTLNVRTRYEGSNQGFTYLMSMATILGIVTINSMVGPYTSGGLLIIAAPLLGKVTYMLAKASARNNAAYSEIVRLRKKNEPQAPAALLKRVPVSESPEL